MKKMVLMVSIALGILYTFPMVAPNASLAGAATGQTRHEARDGTAAASGRQQPGASCAEPAPAQAPRCRQLEASILAATVRLKIDVFALQPGGYAIVDNSLGHATVMAGRYLVTHNHFGLSLENLDDGYLRTLTAYHPDGSVIVQDAPFHVFDIIVAEPQTLVFDFGDYGRTGALAYIGMASAGFREWQSLDLRPDAEVAQVNWDGAVTTVDWVRVSGIRFENGLPVVELDSFAVQGSSGGGIFYDGYHVGNNWFRGTDKEAISGQVMRQFTVAALNTADLVALADSEPRDAAAPAPNNLLPETGTAAFLPR